MVRTSAPKTGRRHSTTTPIVCCPVAPSGGFGASGATEGGPGPPMRTRRPLLDDHADRVVAGGAVGEAGAALLRLGLAGAVGGPPSERVTARHGVPVECPLTP